MDTQNIRKSCEDYVKFSCFSCKSLTKAKTWEVVSYVYSPISNN